MLSLSCLFIPLPDSVLPSCYRTRGGLKPEIPARYPHLLHAICLQSLTVLVHTIYIHQSCLAPGLSTRTISRMAWRRPSRLSILWIARLATTTSKLLLAKGRSRMSPSCTSTRSSLYPLCQRQHPFCLRFTKSCMSQLIGSYLLPAPPCGIIHATFPPARPSNG